MDQRNRKADPAATASAETTFAVLCVHRRGGAPRKRMARQSSGDKRSRKRSDRPMLCRGSKPATMRKRTVRTAGQSITPQKAMANIPRGDSRMRTPRPMEIRPTNPHLNPRLKIRQLLHLKRSRQYTA